MNITLAADMHLKPGTNREQNTTLTDFLETCQETGSLILIGDTFNCWFEKNGKYVGSYSEVLKIFSDAIKNGLKIDLISGNRDFVFSKGRSAPDGLPYSGFSLPHYSNYSVLSDIGINLRGWVYEFENDGVRYHCAHGDVYCIDDIWHQLLRYLIMGNPARYLSRVVPRALINLVFQVFSAYDRRAGSNEYEIYDYLLMQDEALIPIIDSGVDHILCGHLHQYMTREVCGVSKTGRLTVLPCWAGGEYAVLENNHILIKNLTHG